MARLICRATIRPFKLKGMAVFYVFAEIFAKFLGSFVNCDFDFTFNSVKLLRLYRFWPAKRPKPAMAAKMSSR